MGPLDGRVSLLSQDPNKKFDTLNALLDEPLSLSRTAKVNSKLSLLLLAYVAFIALGMPDGLLGVAWPSMRADFSIPIDALGMLLLAAVTGYMTSSFMSGVLIGRMGVGRLLAGSCALTGLALVGYTLVPSWWMMVLLGVMAGLGAGAIDAGLNTYVAAHYDEGVMQWLHACYGVGVTLGPIIMTIALTALNTWRVGYRVVSGFQIALAACFLLTLPLWNQKDSSAGSDRPKRLTEYKTPMGETLRQPRVWLSALLFFMYVGAEVSFGTWTYSLLVESRGISPATAGLWAGSYWATFTVGRIVAGVFAKRFGIIRLVLGGLTGALLGAALLAWNPSDLANLFAVVLIGFSIAPIFPAFMSGTSQRVGAYFAANTIGMQMAASGLGTAIIPSLLGVLARRYSLEVIPVTMVIVLLGLLGLYLLSIKERGRSTMKIHQESA
jgi:fucose permease